MARSVFEAIRDGEIAAKLRKGKDWIRLPKPRRPDYGKLVPYEGDFAELVE